MIAMAKAVYYPKGERQKTIIKLLNSLEGRYSRWDIWQDFIVLSAVSIANAFGGPYREQREAMYLERSKKYSTSELEVLAQMLAEVVDEMEQNPDQDMLGELFMALGLANEWKGQFFTPYPQRNDAECITLSEACMEDHVAVEIRSTETGMCFEEHVTCDEDGNLNHAERDLSRCKCRNCGEISLFGSFEDLDDAECSECGERGFDRCEEE